VTSLRCSLSPGLTRAITVSVTDQRGGSANLGALLLNGGFSPTHKPGAVCAGVNNGRPQPVGPDQRHFARPRGGACEKGSVEL
jgi:hypothetical protein